MKEIANTLTTLKDLPAQSSGSTKKDRRYCNFCDVELTDAFIHGKTIYGMWADMCVSCHLEKGTGPGQLYVFRDGKWQRKQFGEGTLALSFDED
jgi:hypothetical protein